MKKVLAGMVLGVALLLLAAYSFFAMGGMPVATRGKALPLEKFLAGMALHAAMGNETEKPSPVDAGEANLVAGAKVYQVHCSVCHGLPHQPASAIAKGMFPPPPFLMPPKKGVTDDPVGETYWKARNGIRLTGMPGFVDSLSDTELWQVSQLLLNADKLPAAAQELLKPETRAAR